MQAVGPYLPEWATLEEAESWLEAMTGEPWPLPRLLAAAVGPSVWLKPDADVPPSYMEHLFEGRSEGYLAPVCFGGDCERLAIDRTGALSVTRTPSGTLVRFTPPIDFTLSELRFPAPKLRRLAEERKPGSGPRAGPALKKRALVAKHVGQWPSIERDLSEASRNGLNAAKVAGRPGWWIEDEALSWAKANDRLRFAATDPSSVFHRLR